MPIYSTAPLIIVLCHSSHFLNAYVEISTRLFQRYHVPFLKYSSCIYARLQRAILIQYSPGRRNFLLYKKEP